MRLEEVRTVYFIGIGGIGMSALARYFKNRGADIHGYDRVRTSLTRKLEQEGMRIHYSEDVHSLPRDIDLVVFTPAIPKTHRELQYLESSDIPVVKRSEVLGLISRNRRCIAVAGTHGKTSTSAILTHLLKSGGIDCTAFVGGIMKNYGSNFLDGGSEWMIAEADEFDRSFLRLHPEVSILSSMDPDHLDIYGDPDRMKATYAEFLGQTDSDGMVLISTTVDRDLADGLNTMVRWFGEEDGDLLTKNIRTESGKMIFDVRGPDWDLKDLIFSFPGRHNVLNATAAIGVCKYIGVSDELIRKGLADFRGIKRRFERVLETDDVVFIDDYAHHPTEIRAFLEGVRQLYPGKKVCGVFQPHLYSRTNDFAQGFAEALSTLDELVLLDIYPAREEPIAGVSSDLIGQKITGIPVHRASREDALELLKDIEFEVLLTIGAGNIDTLIEPIKRYVSHERGHH